MTRRHERRKDKLTSDRLSTDALFINRDLKEVAGLYIELFRIRRTDQRCVVPGQLRDWVRQFLKPAVIGVAAVVHRITACQYNLR